MEKDDLLTIVSLEEKCFQDAWSLADFTYELSQNPYSKMWVLAENDTIIGYYGIWVIFDRAELTTIAVIDERRHQGYGRLMLEHALNVAVNEGCEYMTLEVRVSNESAQKLYLDYGFEIITTKKDYYKTNHEDAYMMMKGLV